MQIDSRSHPLFLASADENGIPRWQKPADNIDYGTGLISDNLKAFPESLPAAVAAYNAGISRIQMTLKRGVSPDSVTTGHDYAVEVMHNATDWHEALVPDPFACRCRLCLFSHPGAFV